jgi:hypothetical protein
VGNSPYQHLPLEDARAVCRFSGTENQAWLPFWFYAEPKPAVACIKGRVAFWNDVQIVARQRRQTGAKIVLTARGDPQNRKSSRQHARGFCDVGRDCIHQRRRQTIVGLKAEFSQPGLDRAHAFRPDIYLRTQRFNME